MNQWRIKEKRNKRDDPNKLCNIKWLYRGNKYIPHLSTREHKKNQLTILNTRPINTRYSKAALMLVTKRVLSVLFNNAVDFQVHTASAI
jgi:DNA polymerase IIIc chi subunit